jgi:hypothetical protein
MDGTWHPTVASEKRVINMNDRIIYISLRVEIHQKGDILTQWEN